MCFHGDYKDKMLNDNQSKNRRYFCVLSDANLYVVLTTGTTYKLHRIEQKETKETNNQEQ